MQRIFGLFLCALVAGAVMAHDASASGVGIVEHGRGLANAYAGGAAVAEDATTVWWNPAGMARLERNQTAFAAAAILPTTEFVDQGSSAIGGAPLTGPVGVDGGEVEIVPSAFGVWKIDRRWRVGVGLNVPFGLSTDYGREWIGRYYATETSLFVLNASVAGSYRVNRQFSVGAGVNVQYLEATLANSIDIGALAAMMPQAADGHVTVEGDSWAVGFNVGLLFEPTKCTRFGVTYHSATDHDLEGDADFEVPAPFGGIVAATGMFADTGASTSVTMPSQISVSAYHELNRRWAIMGDVTWTEWSQFQEVRILFDNAAQAPSVLDLQWDDALRYSLGVTFKANNCLTLRGGVAYDETPIPDATRTPRIPGTDRLWIALGLGYKLNRNIEFDVGYALLIIDDSAVNQTSPTRGTLRGQHENTVNIVGVQLTWLM